jgi:shikimate kinase
MRCTGKSTVGRLLAQRLCLPFYDTDDEIEALTRTSIAEIFDTQGEPAFRQLETQVLSQLSRLPEAVIATGGGIVLLPDNRRVLKTTGTVIWLRADPKILWQRMQADPVTRKRRPPLQGGGEQELVQLHEIRRPIYEELADLIFDSGISSPAAIVEDIILRCRMA